MEHQSAIRNQQPEKSALCEHSMIHDHRIARQEAQILKTELDFPNGYLLKQRMAYQQRIQCFRQK